MRKTEEQTQVQDLYEGAYLLCRGFKFTDLTVTDSNGRKIATFVLSGKEVLLASEDYKSGRATANVKLIKDAVNLLRDAMNHKIIIYAPMITILRCMLLDLFHTKYFKPSVFAKDMFS